MYFLLAQAYNNYDDFPDSGGASDSDIRLWIFWLILILIGSVWIKNDSTRCQIPCFGRKFDPEKDPLVWALLCFFCCLGFIYYFYRKQDVLYERGRDTSERAYLEGQLQNLPVPDQPKPAAAPPASPVISLESQLVELQRIKERGLITETEFEQKKRQILGL